MPDPPHIGKTRACSNCSRAKVKCLWPSDNDTDTCQRCSEKKVTCSESRPVSKRKRGKATHSRIIDQKLDNIMSLLSRDRERLDRAERMIEQSPFSSKCPTPTTTHASFEDSSNLPKGLLEEPFPPPSGSITIVPGFQLRFSEADQVLREYMTAMVPEFPFVPVTCDNSYEMYKKKPLLLKTILWLCRPPGPEESAAFESWFRNHVAHQTVVLTNKSLELIQAILVFLAWKDIYFYAAAKETSLLHLAAGLAGDLGLDTPRRAENSAFASIVEDAAELRNDPSLHPEQQADDHRAILGLYYTMSTLCSVLGKRSRLEYTPHLDHCSKQLKNNREYPTDLLLANLVHVQQIAAKVDCAFWEMIEVPSQGQLRNVYSLAVASIQKELDAFVQQLPDDLRWNHLLQTHCSAIRIRLFESFKHAGKNETVEISQSRYRMAWDCLMSTQTLCNTFRLVPIESYPSLTFVSILHVALAVIKASRLFCVENHVLDLNSARAVYNLPDSLHQLSNLFEVASNLGSPRCNILLRGRPIFSEYARAYRDIQQWYWSKMNPGVANSNATSMDPEVMHGEEQTDGLDFWNQFSILTNGLS